MWPRIWRFPSLPLRAGSGNRRSTASSRRSNPPKTLAHAHSGRELEAIQNYQSHDYPPHILNVDFPRTNLSEFDSIPGLRCTPVMLTPDIARRLLERNVHNRKLSK